MRDVAGIDIRFATIDEILSLRQAVIIAGTDRDSPYFPGDHAPATRHIGAFATSDEQPGACLACATFLESEWEGGPAWQLRGMATAPGWRGKGLGLALLQFAESALHDEGDASTLWCEARESATGFYGKAGWAIASNRFIKPGVGPHYTMVKCF